MNDRTVEMYLWDISRAIERLRSYVADSTLDGYLASELLRAAVEREFIIVGEALTVIRRMDPAITEQVAHAAQIIGFRNALVHGYHVINHRRVWQTVQEHLGELHEMVHRLLQERG